VSKTADSHQQLKDAIGRYLTESTRVSLDVLAHPETGYQEHFASQAVADALESHGYDVTRGLAITGLSATWDSGLPGPTCVVGGELDALIVPDHPHADRETGAAHACGHHAQLGVLLAVAAAFASADLTGVPGRVRFVATPAEETIELARKVELREAGAIEFIGGKQELVRLGVFDDVDAAFFSHATSSATSRRLTAQGSTNGHVAKELSFLGKAAHAGVAPFEGVNALKAATLTLTAIDALRDTFREEDVVRVHPIVTHGGDAVNVVPANAAIETYVRAKSLEALSQVNAVVDRAAEGASLAIGAELRILNWAGYLPLRTSPGLTRLMERHAADAVGAQEVGWEGHMGGTTDVGDISNLIPTANLWFGGARGGFHSADFVIDDHEPVIGAAATTIAATVIDFLKDGERSLLAGDDLSYLTTNEYLQLLRSLTYDRTIPLPGQRLADYARMKGNGGVDGTT
jgi:amidohydrolase